ncbi:MAG: hypothetical protein IKU18_06580, partial [Bacteroidales bacterium]|nr:hypothetical protein [Bacteroidales bacterium]
MIKEIRILIIMLCLGALAIGSCAEHSIEPEAEQPELISFAPMSEATQVKASTPLPTLYPDYDFGVWGIARESLNSPYILWEANTLTRVTPRTESTSTGNTSTSYIPEKDAYWFKGYTYNFIAIAPYNDSGFTLTDVVTKEEQEDATPAVENPTDYITFTYNISNKYTGIPADGTNAAVAPNLTFDLLGAVAEETNNTANRTEAQTLTFWHLFSQININVSFDNLGTDAAGNAITGSVSQMRLYNIDTEANYTITNNGIQDPVIAT